MSSLPAGDDRPAATVRRARRGPWVSRRTLIVFWALWLPFVGFMLITPELGHYEDYAAHPDQPALLLSLVNGSRHDAALVIRDEVTGEQQIEWLGDTSRGTSERGRPGDHLRLAIVSSNFAAGEPTRGECDVVVPATGTTRILVQDDGSGTIVEPGDETGTKFLMLTPTTDDASAAGAPPHAPIGVMVLNRSSRRLKASFRAEDGTTFEQLFHGSSHSLSMPRPMVPGERLHASWELAAPVTDGGMPLHVERPGDLKLQVRVFPDGSWEIGSPSLLALLRVKLAMFAAVFTGD